MAEDIKWILATAADVCMPFAIALIATFTSLSASIKDGDDKLHERVNRVRDEYVKRVDLDDHIRHLRDSMRDMRAEEREGM